MSIESMVFLIEVRSYSSFICGLHLQLLNNTQFLASEFHNTVGLKDKNIQKITREIIPMFNDMCFHLHPCLAV